MRLSWIIDPRKGRGAIYRSLTDVREVDRDDLLDGEDVVPGFRWLLGDLFK